MPTITSASAPASVAARLAVLAATTLLLASCGDGGAGVEPDDTSPTDAADESPEPDGDDEDTDTDDNGDDTTAGTGTELVIDVAIAPDGEQELVDEDFQTGTWTLTCDPPGGDHPDPEEACAVLAEEAPDIFEPVPADQVCTQIYGGPQLATVTGQFEGQEVDAAFSLENGCEIDRWDRMGPVLEP